MNPAKTNQMVRRNSSTASIKPLTFILLFFILSFATPSFHPGTAAGQELYAQEFQGHYLLMQPIESAIRSGDFSPFKDISTQRISVNIEAPFHLRGYVGIDKFVDVLSYRYSQFKTEKIEWASKHIEENYAVQSVNVILFNKRTDKEVYFKFIFFMHKQTQWQIYYLKGLKI